MPRPLAPYPPRSSRGGLPSRCVRGAGLRRLEPSPQAIRNWVCQPDREDGRRSDGLPQLARSSTRSAEASSFREAAASPHAITPKRS